MIDKDISLLIWDYLFIEGNIVLLKSFLAIYYYLSDKSDELSFFLIKTSHGQCYIPGGKC